MVDTGSLQKCTVCLFMLIWVSYTEYLEFLWKSKCMPSRSVALCLSGIFKSYIWPVWTREGVSIWLWNLQQCIYLLHLLLPGKCSFNGDLPCHAAQQSNLLQVRCRPGVLACEGHSEACLRCQWHLLQETKWLGTLRVLMQSVVPSHRLFLFALQIVTAHV